MIRLLRILNLVQLAQLQMELQRMKAENHKLRDMLSHVSNNYSTLQMHFFTLLQQNQASQPGHEAEVNFPILIILSELKLNQNL